MDHNRLSLVLLLLAVDQLQPQAMNRGGTRKRETRKWRMERDVILGQVARIDAILNPVDWLFDREQRGCYFLLKF